MPKPNFKSITINEKKYDQFHSTYLELKELDKIPPGVSTFSGYVTHLMLNYVKEKETLSKLASKIKTIPKEFTTTKTIIDPIVSTPEKTYSDYIAQDILL